MNDNKTLKEIRDRLDKLPPYEELETPEQRFQRERELFKGDRK